MSEAGAHAEETARRAPGRGPTSRAREDVLFQDVAAAWIREHRDAALLAAFAVGVFMGAWMRG